MSVLAFVASRGGVANSEFHNRLRQRHFAMDCVVGCLRPRALVTLTANGCLRAPGELFCLRRSLQHGVMVVVGAMKVVVTAQGAQLTVSRGFSGWLLGQAEIDGVSSAGCRRRRWGGKAQTASNALGQVTNHIHKELPVDSAAVREFLLRAEQSAPACGEVLRVYEERRVGRPMRATCSEQRSIGQFRGRFGTCIQTTVLF